MEQLELFEDKKNQRFGVYLDHETVDRITVANLKSYRDSMIETLKDHRENGSWLHPEDIPQIERSIEAVRIVLRDYGEHN